MKSRGVRLSSQVPAVAAAHPQRLAHGQYILPRDRHASKAKNIAAKKNAAIYAAFFAEMRTNYFDTDFLNMRSIFSLVASQQAWLDWDACNAWLAVLCAPSAADLAELAAFEAESAAC